MLIKFAHQLITIGLGVLGLGFITAFHELGHFVFCKLFKIRTPSFSVGFGPRLIQKKIGDTVFAISAIPMGGYVEIAGAQEVGQGEQKEAFSTDSYAFNQKPYWQKMLVLAGGILFNLFFAFVVLTIVFMVGIEKSPILYPYNAVPVVEKVLPESPAEQAGILPSDRITGINGENGLTSGQEHKEYELYRAPIVRTFYEHIINPCTQEITLQIDRDWVGQAPEQPKLEIKVPLKETSPRAGITLAQEDMPARSLGAAMSCSAQLMKSWITNTFSALANIFKKRTTCGLGGPISIIAETAKGAGHSGSTFLIILCFISVGLAMINLLPLPIFDGGQAVFYTVEAITGWDMEKARLYIHYVSWALVVILMLYLSYKDIMRLIFG